MIYNKETENFTFKHFKDYNVSRIKEIVNEFKEEWFIDQSRQEKFTAHRFTNSYIMSKKSLDWTVGNSFEPNFACDNAELGEIVLNIIRDLESYYDGKVGQALFIKLASGKEIDPHTDTGEYLYKVCRNHIPIITNERVGFIVAEETVNMKEGECWEINNNKTHSVFNFGKEDRIHLLIDIMPNKYLGVSSD
jgi:hypothetical protein